jgi:hypothetical protein
MSKRQRRVVFWCSPLVIVVGLLVWGKLYVDRLDAGAQQLAQLGQVAQKVLGEYRTGVEKADVSRVLSCIDEAYSADRSGLGVEGPVSERDGVRVYEWSDAARRPFTKTDVGENVAEYLKGIGAPEEVKFKLDSVEEIISPEEFRIRSFLWVRGSRPSKDSAANDSATKDSAAVGASEAFETQLLFRMWMRRDHEGSWKITRQELIHGTTVTGDRRGFTDMWGRPSFTASAPDGSASSAGIDFVSRKNPNFFTPRWEPKKFEIIKYGPAGVSAVDYDDDGWYDIFFADGERPRLYRNRGGGSFEDVTERVGLPASMPGVNVGIFADFDNDGVKDIFLGCFTDRSRLFKGVVDSQDNTQRKFVDVTDSSGLVRKGDGDFVVVATAGDYDNDGRLDLYLGRYLDPRKNLPTTLFYTRNGEGNSLLHNDGKDGKLHFTDVTREAGITESGLSLGVAWADFDNDNDLDMYVANDFGRDALLRNNGNGTFTDVSRESGAFDPGYGMSASWGDLDGDGDLDIYVSDVHSGQRWYGQAATLYKYLMTSTRQGTIFSDFPAYKEIYGMVGADWSSYGDQVVKGNALYLNDGSGHFKEVTERSRTNPFGWFWGNTTLDYDGDGRLDIYAANGWISSKSKDDL